jgi:predicted MFS family arabinose efflux permease
VATAFAGTLPRLLANSPLRHPVFRQFYAGSIGVAVGYTMQATVAAWLMATLTPSALMVALVQTASTAPSMLFGLFAGALADIIERRRIILVTQCVLLAAASSLGLATLVGVIGPLTLLALTFAIGGAFAFYMPAQQASINELVGRAEVSRAVALGAVAFNMARAIGPALAGALAAWIGTGSALVASAVFFVPMIFAVRRWQPQPPLPGVPETVISGVQSGLRFARHSGAMRAFIIRNLVFAIAASAFWALLPVIARDQLGLGAGGFGLLSAAFGSGAITGALLIPGQLSRHALAVIVRSGTFLWAGAIALLAITPWLSLALYGAFAAGTAWVTVFASISAGTQSAAPAWVRARAVAMYFVAVQASLAVGSAVWGAFASGMGTRIALALSATAMLGLSFLVRNVRVAMGREADVTPSLHLPEITPTVTPLPDDGPVLIQIEYQVDPPQRAAFLRAVRKVGRVRRRNGATSWRVFRDIGEESRFVERYVLTSWSEYVRLRARMTVSDRDLIARVEVLQRPDTPIKVSRLIGVGEREVA